MGPQEDPRESPRRLGEKSFEELREVEDVRGTAVGATSFVEVEKESKNELREPRSASCPLPRSTFCCWIEELVNDHASR